MTEEERERREQIKEAQKQGQEAVRGLWQHFKTITGSKIDENGNLGPMTKKPFCATGQISSFHIDKYQYYEYSNIDDNQCEVRTWKEENARKS